MALVPSHACIVGGWRKVELHFPFQLGSHILLAAQTLLEMLHLRLAWLVLHIPRQRSLWPSFLQPASVYAKTKVRGTASLTSFWIPPNETASRNHKAREVGERKHRLQVIAKILNAGIKHQRERERFYFLALLSASFSLARKLRSARLEFLKIYASFY